eukprot:NODE_5822_length_962_cov_59.353993_g5239_i0.p1 GENE.NODE_5822_length_962_cov_59.353993_g5239_i0~~NODE_5822_length_962_cov_59.353993_g5239_i0.p1  ORF type:complete len:281 (-),score=79.09 NODE_5822_length_962_cov_59.353993_g5239_i0:118-861(-)
MFPTRDPNDLQPALEQAGGNLDRAAAILLESGGGACKPLHLSFSEPIRCWADEVDKEIPELDPNPIPTHRTAGPSSLDQFAKATRQSTTPPSVSRASSSPSPTFQQQIQQTHSNSKTKPPPLVLQQQQVQQKDASPLKDPLSLTSLKSNSPPVNFVAMSPADRAKYVSQLENRVTQLEDTLEGQSSSVNRLNTENVRMTESITELRREFAKLIQRQLNMERGHGPMPSPANSTDSSKSIRRFNKASY